LREEEFDARAPQGPRKKIEMKIVPFYKAYKMDTTDERIKAYLASLTPKEHQAYLIAKDHLRDSFDIEKSNGFLAWVKKNYS
jgi:predicted RNA-binding protein with PIN domain